MLLSCLKRPSRPAPAPARQVLVALYDLGLRLIVGKQLFDTVDIVKEQMASGALKEGPVKGK